MDTSCKLLPRDNSTEKATEKAAAYNISRYIIGLTLGPTFLSSSLYLGISMLQRHYTAARMKYIGPKLFATLFILGDFLCLCFIGCGGSLAAIFSDSPVGVDLMIAGLATQVLFTAIFCLVLFIIYKKIQSKLLGDKMRWYMFGKSVCLRAGNQGLTRSSGASLAAACLFVRSCWRVAELSDGFNGPLASKEGIFIALDSIPMIFMCTLLTGLHPWYWFGDGRSSRKMVDEYNLVSRV